MAQNQRRPQTAAVLNNRPFQQLGSLIKPIAQASRKLMLPNLYFIGEDGVDHINIAFDGKTDLGHALHQNSKFRFVHNLFGPFLTVEGFFRWLASEDGDDLYRTLNGIQCAHHAKRTKNKGFIPNLRFLIVDATWQKIQAYPEIQEDLIYSEMPFDSYFYAFEQINGQRVGTRTRYKNASWLVEGVEVIRNALKNGEIPNFEFLMDDREEYDRMVDLVMKAKPPVKVIEPKEPVAEEEPVQPRPPQVQNPPGTGKKGRQKARRLERERLEAEKIAGEALTLVPIEPVVADPEMIFLETNADMSNVTDFPAPFSEKIVSDVFTARVGVRISGELNTETGETVVHGDVVTLDLFDEAGQRVDYTRQAPTMLNAKIVADRYNNGKVAGFDLNIGRANHGRLASSKEQKGKLIPVLTQQNADKFVSSDILTPIDIEIAGEKVKTSPLAVGKKMDLLGMCVTSELLNQGLVELTDCIHEDVELVNFYLAFHDAVFKIPVSSISTSKLFQDPAARFHVLKLDFNTEVVFDISVDAEGSKCFESIHQGTNGRGLTSCINMVDEAPFQEHLPVASPAQADDSTGTDVVLELKSIEDADREYVNIWAKENQPAPNFGGFGLPAQPSFVGVQTSNDLGEGLPLDDNGPTQ